MARRRSATPRPSNASLTPTRKAPRAVSKSMAKPNRHVTLTCLRVGRPNAARRVSGTKKGKLTLGEFSSEPWPSSSRQMRSACGAYAGGSGDYDEDGPHFGSATQICWLTRSAGAGTGIAARRLGRSRACLGEEPSRVRRAGERVRRQSRRSSHGTRPRQPSWLHRENRQPVLRS